MHKTTPSELKSLDFQLNEPNNQISIKVPKVVKQTDKKQPFVHPSLSIMQIALFVGLKHFLKRKFFVGLYANHKELEDISFYMDIFYNFYDKNFYHNSIIP